MAESDGSSAQGATGDGDKPKRTRGGKKPLRIEDARLVAFVMRTFGRSRWTQDSPIVPDVWLAYLRAAEERAYGSIGPGKRQAAEPIAKHVRTVPQSLLITPWSGVSAGELAYHLRGSIDPDWIAGIEIAAEKSSTEFVSVSPAMWSARIAAGASRVVADLDLETLLSIVLPETGWWMKLLDDWGRAQVAEKDGADRRLSWDNFPQLSWLSGDKENRKIPYRIDATATEEVARFVCLVGLIRWFVACRSYDDYADLGQRIAVLMEPIFDLPLGNAVPVGEELAGYQTIEVRAESAAAFLHLWHGWSEVAPTRRIWLETVLDTRGRLERESDGGAAAKGYASETKRLSEREASRKAVWMVNLNRTADRAVMTSRQTIKADAAIRVFDVAGDGITFAVIDDGIDATHAAFYRAPAAAPAFASASTPAPTPAGGDRSAGDACTETASSPSKNSPVPQGAAERLERTRVVATYDFTAVRDVLVGLDLEPGKRDTYRCALRSMPEQRIRSLTSRLRRRMEDARNIDWDVVERMIRVTHDGDYFLPVGGHGTHVAGIMAANWERDRAEGDSVVGICPGMNLYDLRVFDGDGKTDEFAILCALEFVQWNNKHREAPVIHGVNLSLAMVHDISNFACGQTPVCDASNRLVGAGVVVVAAAGNFGYGGNAAAPRLGDTYRPSSITDPGNADLVITVGSTHRRDPHAYGVSYFSARGPTGDGRRKPDLLAPGEKIVSTAPGDITRCLDGTSMAAPHVAGAAALLMARYPELVGNPCRIKEILKKSATDLGREPYYQGAGVLDILRAMQSV